MESFEAQNYLKSLAKLNKELRELEERATKGQNELEQRITAVNKKYNAVLPASYVDAITRTVKKIDLVETQKLLEERLGGPMDYDQVWAEFQDLQQDLKICRDEYSLKARELEPVVPQKPSKAEIDELNKMTTQPSILESLKQRIKSLKQTADPAPAVSQAGNPAHGKGRDSSLPKGPPPQPVPVSSVVKPQTRSGQQRVPQTQSLLSGGPKKVVNKYTKPDYLRRIDSKPMPCPLDVRFRKLQPDPNDYATVFDDPDPRDAAEVKRRQDTPYHQQLRDEWAAGKGADAGAASGVPPRHPQTARKDVSFGEDASAGKGGPRGTSDPTVRRGQRGQDNDDFSIDVDGRDRVNPNPAEPKKLPPTGLDTQELMKKDVLRISNPSHDSAIVPKTMDDFYTSAPKFKDTFTVDDNLGENPPIDEEMLKDRIRHNLDSMKQFFKTKSDESMPFRNYSPSREEDELSKRFPDRPEFQGSFKEIGQPSEEADRQTKQIAQQVSANIASFLNDIVANTRLIPVQPQIPKNWVPLEPLPSKPEDPAKKSPISLKPQSSLDQHYGTLNNMSQSRNMRIPHLLEVHEPNPATVVNPKLTDYLKQLDSNRQSTTPARQPEEEGEMQEEPSQSEGEISRSMPNDSDYAD